MRSFLYKVCASLILAVLFLFSLTQVASAHVVVYPAETAQGQNEIFTIHMPSEKEVAATTALKVEIPPEVTISRVEPEPGWTYSLTKDQTGKITSIAWTAETEGLKASEFIQYRIQGRVNSEAKRLVWKAYQTYEDNSVVEWVGEESSEKPASVTHVMAADPSASQHGHGAPAAGGHADPDPFNLPLLFSAAAFLLGIAAFFISVMKRAG